MGKISAILALLLTALGSGQTTVVTKGGALPPFSLPRQAGPVLDWKPGRPTVLCVVAYWCDTWKAQLQRLGEAKKILNGIPCDFLVVSVDGRWTALGPECAWATKLTDPGAAWSKGLGIDKIPYTLVVDPTGRIVFSQIGVVRSDEVAKAVREPADLVNSEVFLTFDDFPAKSGDAELLDILRAEHVPATFFCIGRNLEARPNLGKRAANEGHQLQMHSWNHSSDAPELNRLAELIQKLATQRATLYRPPGSQDIKGLSQRPPVVDPYDYRQVPAPELLRRVLSSLKPGAVIQLHAGVPVTREILPELIAALRDRGYRFGVLR